MHLNAHPRFRSSVCGSTSLIQNQSLRATAAGWKGGGEIYVGGRVGGRWWGCYLVVIAKAVVVDGVVVHQLQHEVVILLPVPIYVNNNISS